MGPRTAAGISDKRDHLSTRDAITLVFLKFVNMTVSRYHPVSVIYGQHVANEPFLS
jgi:hypothetical protein